MKVSPKTTSLCETNLKFQVVREKLQKRLALYPEVDFGLYKGFIAAGKTVSTLDILNKMWTLNAIKTTFINKAAQKLHEPIKHFPRFAVAHCIFVVKF